METLENMLFEAASQGNVDTLKKLVQEDPIILDRVIVNSFSDTPVHIAAILGHSDFVMEILRRRPEFARELNLCQSSPLHLASAKGYIELVRVLLSANPLMCLVRDRNGLTPLHLAAIKGRIEVVKELVQAKHDAARVIMGQGQTILHLCVKYYQIEALKLLVNTIRDQDFTNCKDSDGNTILHLAVADKQDETVNFLLMESATEVNAQNLRGMTAMDVLIHSRRDVRDDEIEETLKRAGAFGSMEKKSLVQINRNIGSPGLNLSFDHFDFSSNVKGNRRKKMFKQKDDWLEKKRSALMVVASLIATMAFQVGVNPPSILVQDNKTVNSQSTLALIPQSYEVLESIFILNHLKLYGPFLIANTTGLIASLSIILLLMSDLPLKRRLVMGILMVITWIAITAVALTYLISIIVVTPEEEREKKSYVLVVGFAVVTWVGLIVLLLIGHTIRLIIKMIRLIIKMVRKLIKCSSPKERIRGSGIPSHGAV
ncbi:ankyrin repeat-containing protein BDA1-like [Olea europaea var. sylvestris]|uniref:ankyrin repeat-containing protein BDA1-like n=1 Tax=Olea europaea var. sylvestris TaxID=158386 RepID=UPI000C1D216D|nr:ankyrin repeat-containing protein BDA1-like [Olea europaea var. sylvestris]